MFTPFTPYTMRSQHLHHQEYLNPQMELETDKMHVWSVLEKMDEGILASTSGAPEMDKNKQQSHRGRSCSHYGQHSTPKLMAFVTGDSNFKDTDQLLGPTYNKGLSGAGGWSWLRTYWPRVRLWTGQVTSFNIYYELFLNPFYLELWTLTNEKTITMWINNGHLNLRYDNIAPCVFMSPSTYVFCVR